MKPLHVVAMMLAVGGAVAGGVALVLTMRRRDALPLPPGLFAPPSQPAPPRPAQVPAPPVAPPPRPPDPIGGLAQALPGVIGGVRDIFSLVFGK